MLPRTIFVLLVLLVAFDCAYGRVRVRFRVRRVRTGTRTTYRYNPKPSYFDKGGFRTYAKIGAALYITKKLTPSISFRPYLGTTYTRRDNTYCHDCVSINGSNPECENPSNTSSFGLDTCGTSTSKPYCSIEYGVLSNNQTFVRRSCDDRRCRSCSSDFRVGLRRQCHTFQCDLCNWNSCNNDTVEEIFSDTWKGCLPDPNKGTAYTFDTIHTCDGIVAKASYALIALAILTRIIIS